MAPYAGVEIGTTSIRAIVGDADVAERGAATRHTPRGPAGTTITEAVLTAVRMACDRAGVDPGDLDAVGIGSVGPLDLAAGAITDPANLPDHIGRVPLTGPVGELVDAPVHLHNDTTAALIGERFYAERNPDDMVYLIVSSGIGAGVCVDGHVLSGWDGNAGEVGHVTVDPSGAMACGCGRAGHWEAYCSGEGIPQYARHLHDDEPTSLPLSDPGLEAGDVLDAADEDGFADRVLDRVHEWNAIGLATVVHAYAPLAVHVGGPLALEHPSIVDEMRDRLPDRVMSNVPTVEQSQLGEAAVVRGALASAMTGGTGDRSRLRS